LIYLLSLSVLIIILYEQCYMVGISRKRKAIEAIITYSIFSSIVFVFTRYYPLNSDTLLHIQVFAFLTISGYVDIKTKKIPVYYGFLLLPIVGFQWILSRGEAVSYFDLIIIALICLTGKHIKKLIGIGDLYIFSVMTLIYGLKISIMIFCMGLIFIGVYALFCQSIKGILLQKKLRIAFSPCIGVGFIVFMFIGNG